MTNNNVTKLPIIGDDSIMSKKQHGTSQSSVQKNLRWECDWDTADRVCNFNVRFFGGVAIYLFRTHTQNTHNNIPLTFAITDNSYFLFVSSPSMIYFLSIQRHYAEHSGYFLETTFTSDALKELEASPTKQVTFYDSNTGKPLFHVPVNRTWDEFILESKEHGWPSFRDEETNWDNVRCLRGTGEAVSLAGTHLGHNVPDEKGNRYCVNLVSVAGHPTK
jgi:peptide methionine sulfoxide reductase MsrB